MKTMKKIYLALVLAFFAAPVSAAEFSIDTRVPHVGVGQRMEITVLLNTEGETINALEGKVHLPAFLRIESIRDGNSLVSLWVERPNIQGNEISFAGVVPGGWFGSSGEVFSIIATTNAVGNDEATFSNAHLLLHDGHGTSAKVRTAGLALSTDPNIQPLELVDDIEDREPPEPFIPLLGREPSIFDGAYFLVFSTQDKVSGIDRYEVLETAERLEDERLGDWRTATSPYRINDQQLNSFIYVRAIDHAGNIRVSVFEPAVAPEVPLAFLQELTKNRSVILTVILLFIIAVIASVWIRRRERHK